MANILNAESAIPAQGVMNGMGYRVEIRTWYKDGKYLGRNAQFELCDTIALAGQLSGDFYGEWQGTRHVNGVNVISEAVAHETAGRLARLHNGFGGAEGEITHYPLKIDDWGEFRVVTLGVQN